VFELLKEGLRKLLMRKNKTSPLAVNTLVKSLFLYLLYSSSSNWLSKFHSIKKLELIVKSAEEIWSQFKRNKQLKKLNHNEEQIQRFDK
jgi:hypothetical protein